MNKGDEENNVLETSRASSPDSPEQGLAGRERSLDALVAERVMGWRRKVNSMMHGKPQTLFVDADGNEHSIECGCIEDFNPSTSIADAMEVVEKMRIRFPRITIDTRENQGWICQFLPAPSYEYEPIELMGGQYIADDLPEAICRAALAAQESPFREADGSESSSPKQ